MVIQVNNDDFQKEVLDYNGVVIVDFWAPWCGPCKMLAPVVEEVSEETDVKFVKVNTDECPELARKYGIMTIPTLVLFDAGNEVKRSNGVISKSELKEFVS